MRQQGDATVLVLVGEGSPVQLGTPALVLDVELPDGGELTTPVPREFQGFAYLLHLAKLASGRTGFRRDLPSWSCWVRARRSRVTEATPGTRFLPMAGKPDPETPVFNWPSVD